MALSVNDLISSVTAEQAKAKLYSLATAVGLKVTSWVRLSPLRTTYAVLAQMFAASSETQAEINRAAWRETSKGSWLTVVAREVYGVTRNPATFAEGVVEVDNTAGGLYPFAPGELVFVNTATGKTYENKFAVTIDPLETGVEVAIRAKEIGEDSSAAIGEVDDFEVARAGLEVVPNTVAILGEDEEEDDDLKLRCAASLGALSPNGAADAYVYVATTPALNGGAAVTRARVLEPPGDGTVTVVLAGPSGAVSGGDVTLVDDAFQALVVREVDTETTQSAVNATWTRTIDVYYSTQSGYTDSDVETLTEDAITAYIAALPIGGILLQAGPFRGVSWRAIEGVIKAIPYVHMAKLTSETDLVLDEDEVAVAGASTINAHAVGA